MEKLKLIFLTSEGKRHNFYPHVDNSKLTATDIEQIVNRLIALDRQQARGGPCLFAKLEKAVWVEKKTTPIFKKYRNAMIFYKNV